jgi:hypothetical protein
MTEEEQKVKPVRYNLGSGDYIMTVPSANGLYCWGFVAGEHIQFEDKDLKAIEVKISNYSAEANRKYMNKASRFEEIALRIKENGLEKTAKDLGEKK